MNGTNMNPAPSADNIKLTSQAFSNGENIPVQYTCKGDNVSPPLNIINIPESAKSLTLIMHDPDAPGGDFVHWLIWDIPPNAQTISASSVPVGAVQGVNSFGINQYGGPCPPAGSGTHRYIFELYALKTSLNLSSDTDCKKLESALAGHVLAKTTLTGLMSAES